ncbi:two-component sensor histidine kinase [Pseudorhizobium tarimense]|uniref:histidine kinase n=1 Tax=Pseudorhizobium tarimense TaxID=1079109 RepID=A0ABV2HB57_9HYPH
MLLGDDHTTAAKLDDLVLSTLRPFVSEQQPTLISGPPLLLPPKQALTLTIAAHELATNSMKYGALSVPSGRVSITWDCVRKGGEEKLSLAWRESGGPPVETPNTTGFGTRMIKQALAADFEGSVELNYDREGVTYS